MYAYKCQEIGEEHLIQQAAIIEFGVCRNIYIYTQTFNAHDGDKIYLFELLWKMGFYFLRFCFIDIT